MKTNIGHTEAAAGLAGAAKAILALQKGSIPQNLHFQTGNPHIDWENARIEVPTAPCAFPASADGRRIAGVSAFGFSGTNAHVVFEGPEPAPSVTTAMERPAHVLTLSARTPAALSALAERWRARFEAGGDPADLCHTANVGRAALEHRTAIVGRTTGRLRQRACRSARRNGRARSRVRHAGFRSAPRIAFMFTGQGAHFAGMGRALYETAPVFRATLDRCAAAAVPHVSRDLREALFDPDPRSLEDPLVIQPANFAFQVALAELWRGWGIEPVAAIGHSLGEYAAAHMAGVFNLEDAMAIVAARGRGAALCHGRGAMVAVSAPHERVMRALGEIGELELAAYNGPEDFVVSGAPQAVEALAETVRASGGRAKILAVPFGSHSRWVEPALPELDAALARVSFSASRIALAANPTGALAAPTEMSNAAYWRAQMRQTVRFASGVEALAGIGVTHFIEIGPHPILCAAGAECLGERAQWLASMRRDSDGWDELLAGVQRLFVDGARTRLEGVRRRLCTPPYCRADLPVPAYAALDRCGARIRRRFGGRSLVACERGGGASKCTRSAGPRRRLLSAQMGRARTHYARADRQRAARGGPVPGRHAYRSRRPPVAPRCRPRLPAAGAALAEPSRVGRGSRARRRGLLLRGPANVSGP